VFGWDVAALLDNERRTLFFCCDQTLAGAELDNLESLVERLAMVVNVRYGIGYRRDFELGPGLCAYGLVAGAVYRDEDMIEADRIGSWFRERMTEQRHLADRLRDVYPLNVLSAAHLAQPVYGLPLGEWIGQSHERGKLQSLSGGASLWRVEETKLDEVRTALSSSNLSIAHSSASK
jgi:hypothetical protein